MPVIVSQGKYDIYHLPEPDNDELLSLDIDSKIPVPLYRLSDIPEVGQVMRDYCAVILYPIVNVCPVSCIMLQF